MDAYSLATDALSEVQLQFYKMPLVFINNTKGKIKLYLGGHLFYQDKEVDRTVY